MNLVRRAIAASVLVAGAAAAAEDAAVHKDQEHGYEIRLPRLWERTATTDENRGLGVVFEARRAEPGLLGVVVLQIRTVAGGETAAGWAKSDAAELRTQLKSVESEQIEEGVEFAGGKAVRIDLSGPDPRNGDRVRRTRQYYVPGDGRVWTYVEMSWSAADRLWASDFDEIRASVRFRDAARADGGEDRSLLRVPDFNFEIRLPSPDWKPLQLTAEAQAEGFFLGVRRGPEIGGGEPVVQLVVRSREAPPGLSPEDIAKHRDVYDSATRRFAKPPRFAVQDGIAVGNVNGARALFEGQFAAAQEGGPQPTGRLEIYAAVVGGRWYILELRAEADADRLWRDEVKALLDSVRFPDTTEDIAGPVADGTVSLSTKPRGLDADEAKKIDEFRAFGFTLVKPKGFARVGFDAGAQSNLGVRVVLEARAPSAYVFVRIRSLEARTIREKPEELITSFAANFEANVRKARTKPERAKEPFKPTTWKGARGFAYEFHGEMPFGKVVETGWLVTHKQRLIEVKVQKVGDADAAFGKALDELLKSFTLER